MVLPTRHPVPSLEEAVKALHYAGVKVSVDSLVEDELLRGGRAGADYLFSLSSKTLWISDEVDSIPILIGDDPTDIESLFQTIELFKRRGKPFYADAILDPIHYGLTDSIVRYHALRQRYADIEIMMGIGNLTELTHADTLGVNAILLGIASELGVRGLLTTEISGHCRSDRSHAQGDVGSPRRCNAAPTYRRKFDGLTRQASVSIFGRRG